MRARPGCRGSELRQRGLSRLPKCCLMLSSLRFRLTRTVRYERRLSPAVEPPAASPPPSTIYATAMPHCSSPLHLEAGAICEGFVCEELQIEGEPPAPANISSLKFNGTCHRLYFEFRCVFWREFEEQPPPWGLTNPGQYTSIWLKNSDLMASALCHARRMRPPKAVKPDLLSQMV